MTNTPTQHQLDYAQAKSFVHSRCGMRQAIFSIIAVLLFSSASVFGLWMLGVKLNWLDRHLFCCHAPVLGLVLLVIIPSLSGFFATLVLVRVVRAEAPMPVLIVSFAAVALGILSPLFGWALLSMIKA